MAYKLKLDLFEGPLDLLLYLIKKNELDICDIAITEVTDQYLEYIELMKELNLDIVGDFLVVAATLMQIKSRELLPPDPLEVEVEEEDPREDLIRRLQEYKQFKEIADQLKDKASLRADMFQRAIDEEELNQIKDDSAEVFIKSNLFDLITSLNKVLNSVPTKKSYAIDQDNFTVDSQIHIILHRLVDQSRFRFSDLFVKAQNRMEVVVTFVAVLELIKQKEIVAVQDTVFGEIDIVLNEKNIEAESSASESKYIDSDSSQETTTQEEQSNG